MNRSLHSVSMYFRTQAPGYKAQVTRPLTQQYNYSTDLHVGLQAQLPQTYAIQIIPAPGKIPRKTHYRKSNLRTYNNAPGHKLVLHNFEVAM